MNEQSDNGHTSILENESRYAPELVTQNAMIAEEHPYFTDPNLVIPSEFKQDNRQGGSERHCVRVCCDLLDDPVGACYQDGKVWIIVPCYNKSQDVYHWVAIKQKTKKRIIRDKTTGEPLFYVARDWKEATQDWIEEHLIPSKAEYRDLVAKQTRKGKD